MKRTLTMITVLLCLAAACSGVEEYQGDFVAVTLKSGGIIIRKDGKVNAVPVPPGKAKGGLRTAEKLANGNWFVVNFGGAIEFDDKGKIVFEFAAASNGRVSWGRRLNDGNTLVAQLGDHEIDNGRSTKKVIGLPHIMTVNPAGKVIRNVELKYHKPFVSDVYQIAQIAPQDDGGFIVNQPEHQATVKYDKDGKFVQDIIVFKEKRRMPISLFQCPNENLVVGFLRGENTGVVEIDKDGKVVWELKMADVPDMKLYNISQAEKLANGNYQITNNSTHWDDLKIGAFTGYPFAEISPDKRIVRALTDNKLLAQAMFVCLPEPSRP